jgi:hypothetical protein
MDNLLFSSDRLRTATKIIQTRGLGGFALTLAADLIEIEKQSADIESTNVVASLNAIVNNIQNCASITYRINEMSFVWVDRNVACQFIGLDIALLLTQIRAIYDYATEAINAVLKLPGAKSAKHKESFTALEAFCGKQNLEQLFGSNIWGELRKIAKQTSTIKLINEIRNGTVHRAATLSVVFDSHHVVCMQILSSTGQTLIPCEKFPPNFSSAQFSNLMDARAFMAWCYLPQRMSCHELRFLS